LSSLLALPDVTPATSIHRRSAAIPPPRSVSTATITHRLRGGSRHLSGRARISGDLTTPPTEGDNIGDWSRDGTLVSDQKCSKMESRTDQEARPLGGVGAKLGLHGPTCPRPPWGLVGAEPGGGHVWRSRSTMTEPLVGLLRPNIHSHGRWAPAIGEIAGVPRIPGSGERRGVIQSFHHPGSMMCPPWGPGGELVGCEEAEETSTRGAAVTAGKSSSIEVGNGGAGTVVTMSPPRSASTSLNNTTPTGWYFQ
jgi:hypothetical protein